MAVTPAVNSCVARFKAIEAAGQIAFLRQRVNDIVESLAETEIIRQKLRKKANELLHVPTIHLREGKILFHKEIEDVARSIEVELKSHYKLLTARKQ